MSSAEFNVDKLDQSLHKIGILDQKYRKLLPGTSAKDVQKVWSKIEDQDEQNINKVRSYLDNFSVDQLSKLKPESINTIFLVVQHAPATEREKYLSILKEFNKRGLLGIRKIAMMEDRILCCDQQKPQLYGTQFCGDDGNFKIWEFEGSLEDLLSRRRKVGIKTDFKEELKSWGITTEELEDGEKIQKIIPTTQINN